MSVIVADSRNATYDGKLSTANGFYRAEAYNMSCFSATSVTLGTTPTNIAVTFANAGNCQGIVLGLDQGTYLSDTDRDITVSLKEGSTIRATVTLTANQMTNSVANKLSLGWIIPFKFASPYPVTTAGSTWSFDVSRSVGTTGSWSLKTSNGTAPFYITWCDTQVSFADNDTPIAVDKIVIDKTASFRAIGLGTGETTRSIAAISCTNMSDTTPDNVSLFEWENPAAAAYTLTVDGLFVIAAHGGFRAGTSDNPIQNSELATMTFKRTPTYGTSSVCGFSCPRNSVSASSPTGKSNLFFYGEIPTTERTTLAYNLEINATATMTIANPCVVTISSHGMTAGTPITFSTTGALPTGVTAGTTYWVGNVATSTFNLYDTYANSILGGATGRVATSGTQSGTHTKQGVLIVTDATGFAINDILQVGKYDAMGGSLNNPLTVSGVSGTTLTLSAQPTTYRRLAGGIVAKMSGYGITINQDTPATSTAFTILNPTNIIISGCRMDYCYFATNSTNLYTSLDDSANSMQWYIGHSSFTSNSSAQLGTMFTLLPPEKGVLVEYNNFLGGWTIVAGYSGNQGVSGSVTIDHNYAPYSRGSAMSISATVLRNLTFTNNIIENASNGGQMTVSAIDPVIKNNTFYGMELSGQPLSSGMIVWWTCVNTGLADIGSNTYDRCKRAMCFYQPCLNMVSENDSFGQSYANTYDLYPVPTSIGSFEIKSPTGTPTIDTSYLAEAPSAFKIIVTDSNNVSNVDSVSTPLGYFARTGDGLTDTIVHTSGSGKFAIRFESSSSTSTLDWQFDTPTGNIQNKDMVVGVWCKINSANYYSGTHQMPRLTVDYDDGTTVYAEAAQSTDWQFLFVPFTPTTTYGQIKIKLTTMTDQTSTNAYVYFDDFSVLYPAGYVLSLGGMDLWSGGFPITPPISTSISAQDVWAADPTKFGASTVGDKVNSIKKDTGLIPALL
jgi:hypothetical protein